MIECPEHTDPPQPNQLKTVTALGGICKISGYSDGNERVGWSRMHRDDSKVLACSNGDRILFIRDNQGQIFVLAPPDMETFLADFEKRMPE